MPARVAFSSLTKGLKQKLRQDNPALGFPQDQKAHSTRCPRGHVHPSKWEADYCMWLEAKVQAGEIHDFLWQFSFPVSKTKDWKADFAVVDRKGNIIEVHEAKGFNPSDDNFRLKLALFFERYKKKYPVFVNRRQVFPSASGKRILGLPQKTKKRLWKR